MFVALAFWCLTTVCCGFAAIYGGRSGRAVALATVCGAAATALVPDGNRWLAPNLAALVVDAAFLLVLLWIALISDRWFPIWYAGLQLLGVISHLATFVAPSFTANLYFLMQGLWAMPMLLTLIVGVAIDRRAGIRDQPRAPIP